MSRAGISVLAAGWVCVLATFGPLTAARQSGVLSAAKAGQAAQGQPSATSRQPQSPPPAQTATSAPRPTPPQRAVLDRYCVGCHNERSKIGGLALDTLDLTKVNDHAD